MHNRGQSLIEVLIAIAVGTILLGGTLAIIVPALRSNNQAQNAQGGAALARELLDNVRVWTDQDWNNLYSLTKGSSTHYYLSATSSPFTVVGGDETITLNIPGLVGYWKLDEPTTGTATNSAGSIGTGTSDGSPTATSSCHLVGCWTFNGSTQRVQITGNPALFQIATGTMVAWIKTSGAGSGYRGIVAKQSAYGMFLVDNEFGMYDWTDGWSGTGVTINDGQWHQVACTFSGITNGSHCYVDGAQRSTTTLTVSSQAVNLMIADANASQYFAGSIDEVRMYNRALSDTEIHQLYITDDPGITFTRSFYVENVNRSSGQIVTSGGTADPSTQKVTISYSWPDVDTPRTISAYLTRSRTRVLWQSDWSGGSGQGGPATTTNSMFASSTGIDFSTTTGSIRINGI